MSTIDQFNRAVASDLTQLAALHDRELDAEAID